MNYYDITYKVNEDIKNLGYNYNGKILYNSLSKYLYLDDRIKGFLDKLEIAVTKLYNSTKYIKHYYNFTIDENKIEQAK